jgi:hypothetical protein
MVDEPLKFSASSSSAVVLTKGLVMISTVVASCDVWGCTRPECVFDREAP